MILTIVSSPLLRKMMPSTTITYVSKNSFNITFLNENKKYNFQPFNIVSLHVKPVNCCCDRLYLCQLELTKLKHRRLLIFMSLGNFMNHCFVLNVWKAIIRVSEFPRSVEM